MQFTNLLITPSIVEPLRYHFSTNTSATNLYWAEDEKERTVDIGDTFDYYKISLGQRPRILVDRGTYQLNKTGLADNLAYAKPRSETEGLSDTTHFLRYTGTANILIEARSKGTCELLADMVSHFVAWTRPLLCDTQGWKEFGLPMAVSSCSPSAGEDPNTPKFQISIQFPWEKEEKWNVRDDGISMKKILLGITLVS